ncbi:unnamed protein product [Ranitomeya imitator]|uniref:Major facilitator superfamily (MFS) profile domain-containing protein n=1 Tax=Ranitomeya imitator TaxID=111125 RepID=A0ABN9L3U7_9NEOB|nr:unnamed protein product [Ranitomeya imitator]
MGITVRSMMRPQLMNSLHLCDVRGFLIDRLGRKTLLWVNYVILALTLTSLTATLTFQSVLLLHDYFSFPAGRILLAAICFLYVDLHLYVELRLGSRRRHLCLPTELFVQSYRPAAYAITGALIWLGLFVIGLAFPFVEEALGTFCFIFFLVYCISAAVFSFWVLPETKDRSMMEILESFTKLNYGAKKDKQEKLVCTRL